MDLNIKWTPDCLVDKCTDCLKLFNYFLRKHHCRLCGKIYCADCLKYKSVLSGDVKTTWSDYYHGSITEKRICAKCNDIIYKQKKIEQLVDTFDFDKLDLLELHDVSGKEENYVEASKIFIKRIIDLQYKSPDYVINVCERNMLWRNAKYLVHHRKFYLLLLKSCDTDENIQDLKSIFKKYNAIGCSYLNCQKGCTSYLRMCDSIELFAEYFSRKKQLNFTEMLKVAFEIIENNFSEKELMCYVPFFVKYMLHDQTDIFVKNIFGIFTTSNILTKALYFELQPYASSEKGYNNIFEKYIQLISRTRYREILVTRDFQQKIENVGKKIAFNISNSPPVNEDDSAIEILTNKIQFKDSANKPVIIPYNMDGEEHKILYKKGNLIKDKTMINIIRLTEILVKQELRVDLNIVTYNVHTLDCKGGLIEMVKDSETLYFIKEKLNSTIMNFIMDNCKDITANDIKIRYINSLAAYSVITYLFGIGDRHLDNIMLTKEGQLFHIDYDFILGRDPLLTDPGIRVTEDMIQAVGSENSNYYKKFQQLCTDIYNVLRRNMNIFIHMIMLIPDIDKRDVFEQLNMRFMPSESEIKANLKFVKNLETQSTLYKIRDFYYFFKKESSLGFFGLF